MNSGRPGASLHEQAIAAHVASWKGQQVPTFDGLVKKTSDIKIHHFLRSLPFATRSLAMLTVEVLLEKPVQEMQLILW